MDIKKIILEEVNDFEWTDDILPHGSFKDGSKFIIDSDSDEDSLVYTINITDSDSDIVKVSWLGGAVHYTEKDVNGYLKKGSWTLVHN